MMQISKNDLLQLYIDSFLDKDFSGLTTKQGLTHEKQNEALLLLTDDITDELLYGGAAGGAKSFTGGYWVMMSALSYPDTRWFVARHELKQIRQSTIPTLAKLCKEMRIDRPYHFDQKDNKLTFANESEIFLLDCGLEPSDPMFERFGSIEFTGGWFEEGGQIHALAYEVLKSRSGRQNNDKYNLRAKKLVTANPTKNWCYRTFYKPFRDGTLPQNKKFLQAFVQDNPFAGIYKQTLDELTDPIMIQRLKHGNWEWDDDNRKLMNYDAILDIFSNHIIQENPTRYMIADIARLGKDKTTIYIFEGWKVIARVEIAKDKLNNQLNVMERLREEYQIAKSNVLVDEDGVGGGIADFGGYKGFVANSTPIQPDDNKEEEGQKKVGVNYKNLKTQCQFKLAEIVNKHQIRVECELSKEIEERIIEDLDSMKRDKVDVDGPLTTIPKDKQKEQLGRSPDDGDTFVMRAYFDLKPPKDFTSLYGY